VVIIQASPAGFNLPSPEYYQDDKTVKEYQTAMEEVFNSLLPTESSRNSAPKLAQAVVDLEKKIAAITPPREDMQDVTVGDISHAGDMRDGSTNIDRKPITLSKLLKQTKLGQCLD
jgi:predicted metalloendopeptidase